jgi:hypothetical protein
MGASEQPPFKRYRDGFINDIRNNALRKRVLKELLEQYESYQVVAATQVADWTETTSNNLNASGVWDTFRRYGLVADVQKLYTARNSNKLLIGPLMDWLKGWDGSPSIEPTSRKTSHLPGVNATLAEQRAETARGAERYVRRRLVGNDSVDPKAAFVYGKLFAHDDVNVADADISVTIKTLDADETEDNHPPAYDAVEIEVTVNDAEVEILDGEAVKKTLRTMCRTLAHASCYHYKTAEDSGAEAAHPEADGQESLPGEPPVSPRGEDDGYGPYVVTRRDFVKGFNFDGVEQSAGTVSCRAQLGPVYTQREADA